MSIDARETADAKLLSYLHQHRSSLLHVIDPFKVPVEQAVNKARALQRYGFAAVILASTDWENFEDTLNPYIDEIRAAASGLPILLHFPPRLGHGMPMVSNADGLLYPFLLESNDPYFAWKSYSETAELRARLHPSGSGSQPAFLHLAALTFGDDKRSNAVMGVDPVEMSDQHLSHLSWGIRMLGLQGVYLYSRCSAVPNEACRYFRARMQSEQLLFASGGVRTAERALELFAAGADFVVFSGALECERWEPVLEHLVSGCGGATGVTIARQKAS
jgi:heptaprenylglyceryl phosphate synthase